MPNTDDPQVVYTDRRSHYTNVALGKASSASHPDWDPDQGFAANRPQIVDVYAYYAGLALAQPDLFLWAGLGHMAGGAVVGGLDSDPGFIPPDTVVNLADLHDQFNTYPSYDQNGAHVFVAGKPSTSYRSAWERIVSADPDAVASGNQDLLRNEQFSIIQPQYDFLSTFFGSGLPTPFTNQIHPYHRSFIEDEPDGDILQADSRWDWITHPQGMWQNWVACGADERGRLLQFRSTGSASVTSVSRVGPICCRLADRDGVRSW